MLPGHNLTALHGELAVIKCVSHFGNPPPILKWFLGKLITPLYSLEKIVYHIRVCLERNLLSFIENTLQSYCENTRFDIIDKLYIKFIYILCQIISGKIYTVMIIAG